MYNVLYISKLHPHPPYELTKTDKENSYHKEAMNLSNSAAFPSV